MQSKFSKYNFLFAVPYPRLTESPGLLKQADGVLFAGLQVGGDGRVLRGLSLEQARGQPTKNQDK